MSNYTLAVGWSTKDTLSDSHEAKVISGADFNTEFSAVQTAVNTKADINGSASETFSATTASSGTNTTQVATTQFVTSAVPTSAFINNLVYPVGSIYTNMAVSTNPATLLGVGTWVTYAAGRVLVGIDGSTFDTLDENLGSETTTLTASQIPAHVHTVAQLAQGYADGGSGNSLGTGNGSNFTTNTSSIGGGTAHTNLQPSVTVYMWKRTA